MRLIVSMMMVLLMVPSTMAGELAGVVMPDDVQVSGKRLQLNGLALRKVVFFKVYVGGLYLPEAMTDGQQVLQSDTQRQVVMHFLRNVGREDLNEAWLEGLEANTPQASVQLKVQFETLCAWMSDVAEGDKLVVTYEPGTGTRIEVKGDVKGVLPGKPFADALFSCWIGPNPGPGKAFREAMLGG
ncbi:chalcone isomerase family protein [Desulfovibrio ferrophilus]|uniref:Putative lipoprotein transmembrane n=1 Tax=Desulfovibrio ferrophilus TaxID=241368 RepID=A0A2Z6AZA3_9BACT|nr:chalcone isomerase family protein [Desulfovibrio ferrophilus]BBD08515.1 putative lipoprotein transmembrane [Desulfovibrio ferrophilus]